MKPEKIYFVGIKGVAMAALAVYYRQLGVEVSGCDTPEMFPTDEILTSAGIKVDETENFADCASGLPKTGLVIYTGAHGGRKNPLVAHAINQKIAVLAHGEALGRVLGGYRQLSVAGCHGKTTVSSMVATVLSELPKKPSYAIGCGRICPLGLPGHAGDSGWFVSEADEYVTDPQYDRTPRFHWHRPEIAVITNIEYDHPDVYQSIAEVREAYRQFAAYVQKDGVIVVNGDDPEISRLPLSGRVVRVGYLENCDYRIGDVRLSEKKSVFTLSGKDGRCFDFRLNVPGRHNITNAALAAVAGVQAGASWPEAIAGIRAYCGARRRLEVIASGRGITCIDDYAHHPTEIVRSLEALRSWLPGKRLIVVFQPHTYSRTKALFTEFTAAFGEADCVVITGIYASAREKDCLGLKPEALARAVEKCHPDAHFAGTPRAVADFLARTVKSGETVVFMGAGDIYSWQKPIASGLTGGGAVNG